ncbi:hypothetical protein J6TS7_41420 [Paenibacillus dendritiformis]|nr:hypothetical protein J6TS7_41420 [Paenibacillus dendritiformis]
MRNNCTPCSALFVLGYPQTPVTAILMPKKTKGLSYNNLKIDEGQDGVTANAEAEKSGGDNAAEH